ncbi:MAG TPA: hypothetical protein VHX86_14865 [Tepidisphaeraceae bacterium]|jgi:hypothetical protein|nr:hypothetical protein [Tepidisphaeraceae bacterium]
MVARSVGVSVVPTLQKAEATIGAIFAFLVGFDVLVPGRDVVYVARGSADIAWLFPIWLVGVLLEGAFLWKLKTALEVGHYPFAPWFALQLRRWPLLLRPIVAGWWTLHFLLGTVASMFLENLIVADAVTWDVRVLRCLIFVGVGLTIAYSANLYALLAITASGGGERIVRQVWRWRIVLDISVAIAAACCPFLVRVK